MKPANIIATVLMFLGIAGMTAFMVYSGYRAYQLTDWPIINPSVLR